MMIVNLNSSDISFSNRDSFSKVDKDYWHIVATLAHRTVEVWATVRVKPNFNNFRKLNFAVHLEVYKVNSLLIWMELPDTVAAHD